MSCLTGIRVCPKLRMKEIPETPGIAKWFTIYTKTSPKVPANRQPNRSIDERKRWNKHSDETGNTKARHKETRTPGVSSDYNSGRYVYRAGVFLIFPWLVSVVFRVWFRLLNVGVIARCVFVCFLRSRQNQQNGVTRSFAPKALGMANQEEMYCYVCYFRVASSLVLRCSIVEFFAALRISGHIRNRRTVVELLWLSGMRRFRVPDCIMLNEISTPWQFVVDLQRKKDPTWAKSDNSGRRKA